MIVGSLLLLLAGVVLLITGLIRGEDIFLVGTIIASLLAAVCLYGSSRRAKARRQEAEEPLPSLPQRRSRPEDDEFDSRLRGRGHEREREHESLRAEDETTVMASRTPERPPPAERQPAQQVPDDPYERTDDYPPAAADDPNDYDVDADGVPADEPAEIPMSSVEAAALMRMDAEVMVVDGRPRFHLGGCVHLLGRDAEPLPAFEAVELGFGACALCRPAQSLLREPTRG